MLKIKTPLTDNILKKLKIGDEVLLNGTIYTARDQAHKLLIELLYRNKKLPFDLNGTVIYYTGPTPKKDGQVIGSCGPTSSYRMDKYTTELLKHGLAATIGKGSRSNEVIDAMRKYKCVYFAATGGAGALLSKCVKKSKIVAFSDLGCEAICKLEVESFPLVVINDVCGRDLYSVVASETVDGEVNGGRR